MSVLDIECVNEDEFLYLSPNSNYINPKVGLIGHYCMNLSIDGLENSGWSKVIPNLQSNIFLKEFQNILESLRFDIRNECVLLNLLKLSAFCWRGECTIVDKVNNIYGFKIETDKYTYLFSLEPTAHRDSCIIYCHLKKSLKRHIDNAQKGIHFCTDKTSFTIEDGGEIKLSYICADKSTFSEIARCRYIDDNKFCIDNVVHCLDGYSVWKMDEFISYLNANGIEVAESNDLPF